MVKFRLWWTGRKDREDQREEIMTNLKDARESVSSARKGLEQVLKELNEKRRGFNA